VENVAQTVTASANLVWGIVALVVILVIGALIFLLWRSSRSRVRVPELISGAQRNVADVTAKYRGKASLEELQASKAFDRYKEYLSAAKEQSRRPMPGWMWALFGVLVAAESYAFNLLLADYVAFGSTPQQQMYAAWGLCFLFSLAFVMAAHVAGKSLYLHGLAQHALRLWKSSDRVGFGFKPSNPGILPEHSGRDQGDPEHVRILNRSEKVSSGYQSRDRIGPYPAGALGVIGAIVLTMICIFVFRVYDLNKKEDEAVRIQRSIVKEKDAEPASAGSKLPSAVSKTKTQADAQVDIGAQASQRAAFNWALGIFSFIFLGVQFSVIYLSRAYGFASDFGEDVYRRIDRLCPTR
jgi:hypothetical protein